MEFNPSNESETLHFSPSKEEEEEGGLSEKGTTMGFIWDKGLSIGKKLVVTGFVVSSVPLLLPPLIVVSAIGLTLSLPFGFVYASYRCTEKLMNKLLPSQVVIDPATIPLPHESEDLDNGGTVEEIQGPGDLEKDVKTSMPAAEEKDDELMEKESEKHVADGKSVGAENPEELDKKHQAADDRRENISGLVETEKGGKKGIWGKLKPSRKRKGHAGEDKKVESSSQESKTSSSDMLSTEAVADKNPANEIMEISREEEQEVARDCIKSEGSDMGCLESSTAVGEVKVGEGGGGEEQQEKKPLVLKTNSENNEQSEMAISDDSKHSLDESALVEVTELKNEQDVARDSIKSKGTDRGSLESSTAVGEVKVTEGGGEEQQEKKPLVLKTNSENNEQSKMILSDDSKHSLDEAALVEMPELKNEEAHHLKGDRTVSDADSVEGQSEDEKIWRKIDLIRAIVGFKTPRHPSYFEELKALYAFTGIELPPLDEDPSDLTEFNNKLHFLMSVIGVK